MRATTDLESILHVRYTAAFRTSFKEKSEVADGASEIVSLRAPAAQRKERAGISQVTRSIYIDLPPDRSVRAELPHTAPREF